MSTLAFLSESPTSVFIPLADNSVNLPDEQTDEYEAIERRLQRVRHCMTLREVFDQHTGMPKRISAPCNVWRLCKTCGDRRKQLQRERLERAVAAGPVRQVNFDYDDDGAKDFARKYKKPNYMRFPYEDEDGEICETMFIATSDDIGQVVDEKAIKRIRWSELVATPEGCHLSGRLGAAPTVEDDSPIVKRTSFVVEGLDNNQIEQAQRDAIRQTLDLNPQTLDDLQKALHRRELAFIRRVTKLGGMVVFSQVMRVPVNMTLVRWKITLPQAIKHVRSANLKSPRLHKARRHHISGDEISPQQRLAEREEYLPPIVEADRVPPIRAGGP